MEKNGDLSKDEINDDGIQRRQRGISWGGDERNGEVETIRVVDSGGGVARSLTPQRSRTPVKVERLQAPSNDEKCIEERRMGTSCTNNC